MRILVTGAATGLGQALTRAFRERGDEVLATDRTSGTDLDLDVTVAADWTRAVAEVTNRWGGLDLLVNNAGIAGGGRIELCTIQEWQRLIDVNLLGIVRGVQAFTPMMKAQRHGAILNVASLAGLVHPAGMGSYNAVKAAVVAFTETIGHELASHSITAHAACPSYFRTNLAVASQGTDVALSNVIASLIKDSPLSADDIAAEIIAGLAAGESLIVPDEAARLALELKRTNPDSYDDVMRAQARKLEALT